MRFRLEKHCPFHNSKKRSREKAKLTQRQKECSCTCGNVLNIGDITLPLIDHRLFIFDWDGTLTTSTMLIRLSRIFNYRYSVSHARPPALKGADYRRVYTNIKKKNTFYAGLYDVYSRFAAPRLRDGSAELLNLLSKRGKTATIFSDSDEYRLLREARLLGIMGKVDLAISAKSIGYYKPHPAGLMLMMDKYKASAKESVYIGDMASDVLTARLAGMHSCAVAGGLERYDTLKNARPNYFFKDIRTLFNKLSEGGT